jgi:hypothetical protein
MQKRLDLSRLRQKLLELHRSSPDELASFLSDHPLTKGTVYTLCRKCSKPSCRCARGQRHETVVLTASVAGKTRLWTIPQERLEEIRQRTRRYRAFRQARLGFVKECARRQSAMLGLIDAVEKARTRQP